MPDDFGATMPNTRTVVYIWIFVVILDEVSTLNTAPHPHPLMVAVSFSHAKLCRHVLISGYSNVLLCSLVRTVSADAAAGPRSISFELLEPVGCGEQDSHLSCGPLPLPPLCHGEVKFGEFTPPQLIHVATLISIGFNHSSELVLHEVSLLL
jgi:hypothetical protein